CSTTDIGAPYRSSSRLASLATLSSIKSSTDGWEWEVECRCFHRARQLLPLAPHGYRIARQRLLQRPPPGDNPARGLQQPGWDTNRDTDGGRMRNPLEWWEQRRARERYMPRTRRPRSGR